MTATARRLHVVTYDIACQRRWRRVFALLRRRGAWRQLSVFLVRTDRAGAARLAADLTRLIDPAHDRVLVAPLDDGAPLRMIGLGAEEPPPGPRVAII